MTFVVPEVPRRRRSASTRRSPRPAASDPSSSRARRMRGERPPSTGGVRRVRLAPRSRRLAAAATADGDPASDYLLDAERVRPVPVAVAPTSGRPLERAADGVYAHGRACQGRGDLRHRPTSARCPSLFGRPADYAHFLGVELGLWYVGPLLVVMPAGFGVYDGGRSTAAEEDALRSIRVDAGSPDALTAARPRRCSDLRRPSARLARHQAAARDRPSGLGPTRSGRRCASTSSTTAVGARRSSAST